jgi:hypothetical protein
MKYIKHIVIVVVTLGLGITLSCEKDDICSETVATTPHLIISFYDVNSPEDTKQVRRLSVSGLADDDTVLNSIIFNTTTDSIVVPLRFQEEAMTTISRFELKRDTDFDSDTDDATFSNTDIIEISYTPKFIYVSRACGYKSIFEDTQINIEPDAENWMFNYEIINSTIENETAAHINIYH